MTVPTVQAEHALLSASGSHKWLNCTPSARLEERFPEVTTPYAEEGRLAHAIAELKMRKQFTDPMGPRTYNKRLQALQVNPLYQAEMLTHTDTYYDYVSKVVHGFDSPPYIVIEKKLDYSNIAPEGFGTGDCIIIGDDTLHIIDFKYGKGVPISAELNPQMMLYAIGALNQYQMLYAIKTVKMTIIQPRLENISEWSISAEDLINWGEVVKPTAQKAFDGLGDYVPGEHCRFCKAKALCRARSEFYVSLEEEYNYQKPPLLTNEEIGQILYKAQNLKNWINILEEYALGACLAGDEVPGWKAVEGRSNRAFTDTDAAFSYLIQSGYEEAVLYERKPITLTAVEKLLGKKSFEETLKDYIEKAPGKPTLATESDKREAITARTTAAQDFKI